MRHYLSKLTISIILVSLFLPLTANGFVVKIENPLNAENFQELVYNIINFLFKISLPVGALMITISAFHFLTSGGDPKKVKTARDIIIWTIVGIIILFLSVAIADAVKNMLGVGD